MLTPEDIQQAIAPKSDQLNAIDLVTGPVVVTVENAAKGNAEQPVVIHLTEFPKRPYKPSKSMLRVIVEGWGTTAPNWAGKRLELYRDPNVTYGGEKVGGIKISGMSHIDKPVVIPLMEQRKIKPHTAKPLPADAPTVAPSISDEQIADATTVDELRELWKHGDPMQKKAIEHRVAELQETHGNA